jgi:hypothetical protein
VLKFKNKFGSLRVNNARKLQMGFNSAFNALNTELNPICHLLALLGDATIVVFSRIRVKELNLETVNIG